MLTSFRSIVAVSLASVSLLSAAPALAQDATDEATLDGVTLSANVALTTDYRFRGVSLSGGDAAIQGGFDISHDSGFYVGTWASSINGGPAYGDLELDVYGGWSGKITDAVTANVGALYYIYPTEHIGADSDYLELLGSLSFDLGPVSSKVGVAYAPKQSSLGHDDNLYVYTDQSVGIPSTPLTLNAHLGYTKGVLAPPYLAGTTDDSGLDYSIGAGFAHGPFELSVAYVGVDGPSIDGFTDDTVVATIKASF